MRSWSCFTQQRRAIQEVKYIMSSLACRAPCFDLCGVAIIWGALILDAISCRILMVFDVCGNVGHTHPSPSKKRKIKKKRKNDAIIIIIIAF